MNFRATGNSPAAGEVFGAESHHVTDSIHRVSVSA
jgi:hypothetical protein